MVQLHQKLLSLFFHENHHRSVRESCLHGADKLSAPDTAERIFPPVDSDPVQPQEHLLPSAADTSFHTSHNPAVKPLRS